jgi:hypothetical protein
MEGESSWSTQRLACKPLNPFPFLNNFFNPMPPQVRHGPRGLPPDCG